MFEIGLWLMTLRCVGARDFPKHRAIHKAGTARIVMIENATHQFAGGKQSGERLKVVVQYFTGWNNAQPTKCKGNAARNAKGLIGWRV